jgi:hypothetical protein
MKKELKVVLFRVDEKTHGQLKKLSYLTDKSIVKLMNESVKKTLNEYKKILTNSDIMLS